MNDSALHHYKKWGPIIGKSLFHCHNERSCETIREIFGKFQNGETEALITDNKKHRVYMRAVRNSTGELIGYIERFEPPSVK